MIKNNKKRFDQSTDLFFKREEKEIFRRKMATTINALVFDSFGGPEKIHIAPITKPEIKNNNDILVKVKAASVNPSDFLYMSGNFF